MDNNEGTAKKITTFEMRCLRRLLNISYRDRITNIEVRNRVTKEIGPHVDAFGTTSNGHREETEMVWSCDKIKFHVKNNSSVFY